VTRLARVVLYAGIAGVVLALSKYHAAYVGGYDFTTSSRFAWGLTYIGLHCVAAYAIGLPDIPRTYKLIVASSMAAAVGAAASMSFVQLFVGDALLPRFVVFGAMVGVIPVHLLSVAVVRGAHLREATDRVLFIGSSSTATTLASDMDAEMEHGAVLLGSMSVDAARWSTGDGIQPLCARVLESGATLVVLDREALAEEAVVTQAAVLHESGVRIRTLSLFYEEWLGKLPVSELERTSLLFDIGELHRARYGRLKRVVDLVVGAMLTVPLLVVMLATVAGNAVANRGPLFYRQVRVGKGGRDFTILKLRTMRADDGVTAGEWTGVDDPRVTPFGRVLRRTHLDELPQVLNIVRGDLSIVGPRPEQPKYVAELTEKLPFYGLRHLVRPGLTGWAQVKYGYAGSESDALEKLQYEFFYLRRQSLVLDLRIIGRTLRSVVGSEGRGR
jgi:lipopolysaccharide/colanic/teichoic acid biosynthesis glycosyltransferase